MGRIILNKKAFTFAETLLAIMLMSVGLVAIPVGINASLESYKKVIAKADALTLISTIATSIEADLSTGTYKGYDENGNLIINSNLRKHHLYYFTQNNPDLPYEGQICLMGPNEVIIPVASEATHALGLRSRLVNAETGLPADEDHLLITYHKNDESSFEKYEYYEYRIQIYSKIYDGGLPKELILADQIYRVKPYK